MARVKYYHAVSGTWKYADVGSVIKGTITAQTDATLSESGVPADAKATGDAIALRALSSSIPTTLPNPHPLTINGIVYDGSVSRNITISGGSGSGVSLDTTLAISGYAADSKSAGDAINLKVAIDQGVSNAGKALVVGSDGNVTVGTAMPATFTWGTLKGSSS